MNRVDRKSALVALRPLPIKAAIRFIRDVHRRLPKLQGAMWAIAAVIDDAIVGVAVVGHPQARLADDGVSLEVTRVATIEANRGGAKRVLCALRRLRPCSPSDGSA